MEFRDDLKGSLAEAAVSCVLRHAGYSVMHAGIEKVFPILPLLDQARYCDLELGALRRLPDLIVLRDAGAATLVEVKYRGRIDRATLQRLFEKGTEQQRAYPEVHTVLIRGLSPRGDAARADDLVRVLPPHRLELLAAGEIFYHSLAADGVDETTRLEPVWSSLRPMTSSFDLLQGENREMLERLVPVIRALSTL